jgi:DNA-binding beta-propeller fold protein YncE
MINFQEKVAMRVILTAVVAGALAGCAGFQQTSESKSYFLSIQDGRAGLVDGKSIVRDAADTLAVIEVTGNRLRVAQQIQMPTSLVGPPSSIAISPTKQLALISAATRRDTTDPKKVVSHDLVSVVELDPSGINIPKVIQTVTTGSGASGISFNREGTLALVANRVEGTVSLLSITGKQVAVIGKLKLPEKSGPAHAAFVPDGTKALVSRDGDSRISIINITGQAMALDQRELFAGLRPYGLDVSPDGSWAAVTNLGSGTGDADTISLIDMRGKFPKVVDTVTVGQTPEGIFFSPDSRMLGVTVIDGSNKPQSSPFHGTARYRLFNVKDGRLAATSEVVDGQWLQGSAFTPDGRVVLVQEAANRQIRLYRQSNGSLADSGERLQLDAAPATIKFWR